MWYVALVFSFHKGLNVHVSVQAWKLLLAILFLLLRIIVMFSVSIPLPQVLSSNSRLPS